MNNSQLDPCGSFSDRLEHLERVWQGGEVPDLSRYVRDCGDTDHQFLHDLIELDLECRWKRFHRKSDLPVKDKYGFASFPLLDDYLKLAPEAHRSQLRSANLIAEEYRVRCRWGDQPSKQSYRERFPDLGAEIENALHVIDQQFANESVDLGNLDVSTPRVDEPTLLVSAPEAPARDSGEHEPGFSASDRGTGDARGANHRREALPAAAGRRRRPGESQPPSRVGRYLIKRSVGQGGFGCVYLGYDDQLDRNVAIKIPHADLVAQSERIGLYLSEARTVANLDHPNIVPVHDVGSSDIYPFFIVSKYIDGTNLSTWLKEAVVTPVKAAHLIETIARAVHHAHTKGVVHRDLKPGNILIDHNGTPFVVDFGLALREENIGRGPGYVGTPAYMSPEQARGEGHRVDGRSDIYSLGVVLYELLTSKKPFAASTKFELLSQIASLEPKPLRQINDAIPKELERICLKALSKRVVERYSTALDLAEDLRRFNAEYQRPSAAGVRPATSSIEPASIDPDSFAIESHRVSIVPKGLRSFDEHDADFFLELLPGPKDRDGLPESIRFWKTRIEDTIGSQFFSVGLIYGPSGCGKSSLLRAGLIPRLNGSVAVIYIEASPADTEVRIKRALYDRFPQLDPDCSLRDCLVTLRNGNGTFAGQKVLIVLDQFEQFLHGKTEDDRRELATALRQCDGTHIQCLLLVRDDFWMAVTRFMKALEIPIQEGKNAASVDLFSLRHARHVLADFGRAFAALPDSPKAVSADQKTFLEQSVNELAQDGKVICVRLALYAEMIKEKEWIPATLKQLGGAAGVGVAFLEQTFCSSAAPAGHRYHLRAAQAVLQALMPEPGTPIKGQIKPYQFLLKVSGYETRPDEFEQLIRLLESEVRLISSTDLDVVAPSENTTADPERRQAFYQLTHDYLVDSLREWLTSKQKETVRGRAELLLADRTALWTSRPERKQLPGFREWLKIRLFTPSRTWTAAQQTMMARASRLHLARSAFGIVAALLLSISVAGFYQYWKSIENEQNARSLIQQLLVAEISSVPGLVADIEAYPDGSRQALTQAAYEREDNHPERVRALIALANAPGRAASALIDESQTSDLQTLTVIRARLSPFAAALREELWGAANADTKSSSQFLRLGTLLAVADADDRRWEEFAPDVVSGLLSETTLRLDAWVAMLQPASKWLIPDLKQRFLNEETASTEGVKAARALARYADAPLLAELLLKSGATQFEILIPAAYQVKDEVLTVIREELARADTADRNAADRDDAVERLRNAAVTSLRLGNEAPVEALLAASTDPTVRTVLMLELRKFNVSTSLLLQLHSRWSLPSARQALLIAMKPTTAQRLPGKTNAQVLKLLRELLRSGRYQSERSAAEWLLREMEQAEAIDELTRSLRQPALPPPAWFRAHDWWITPEGHTMAVLDRSRHGTDKSPAPQSGDEPDTFAISIHEVSADQMRRFDPEFSFAEDVFAGDRCPANKVSLVDAMRYCRWMSEQEHVPDEQMCYPPIDQITSEHYYLTDEQRARIGYRLPTAAEWEQAYRAQSTTPWFFGTNADHLPHFAWYALNSGEMLHSSGVKMPNAAGMFDMPGNVSEWCENDKKMEKFLLCGGSINNRASQVGAGEQNFLSGTGYSFIGFRIARTVRRASQPLQATE